MISILTVAALLQFAIVASAQPCHCAEELQFAQRKIEQNYAGFHDKVDETNRDEYLAHTKRMVQLAGNIEDPYACAARIRKWLAFFNDGHIQINHDRPDFSVLTDEQIRQIFTTTPSIPKWTEKKVKKYLSKDGLHPIEGIWENGPGTYRTAIIKSPDRASEIDFVGIVLRADSIYWMPGNIKVEIENTSEGLIAEYYYRDHNPVRVSLKIHGDEIAEFEGISQWVKKYPEVKSPSDVDIDPRYFSKHNRPPVPDFRKLDQHTVLLTLPSFGGQHASIIDSLITHHFKDITTSENLIIDLRGNRGGSDFCYAPLVPLIYTHPIFTDGVSIYASEDNIRSWEILLEDEGISPAIKIRVKELVDKMKSNLNGFVEVPGEEVRHDTVYSNPQKIGIIVDNTCASSTEQFILTAKQSGKVTVFGESTAGVLDYANMRSVDMIGMPYKLFYATSRSNRLPENPIDAMGISPDIELPENADWIAEVRARLKKLD